MKRAAYDALNITHQNGFPRLRSQKKHPRCNIEQLQRPPPSTARSTVSGRNQWRTGARMGGLGEGSQDEVAARCVVSGRCH